MVGVSAILDALGPSRGSEVFAGARLGAVDLSARCRPGIPQTGIGLMGAFEYDLGVVSVSAGLRADVYVPVTVFGGGVVLAVRRDLVAGFGVIGSASFEAFAINSTAYHRFASVLSLGADWRL